MREGEEPLLKPFAYVAPVDWRPRELPRLKRMRKFWKTQRERLASKRKPEEREARGMMEVSLNTDLNEVQGDLGEMDAPLMDIRSGTCDIQGESE